MAYIFICALKHIKKLYQYLNGPAHRDGVERNLAVDSINMIPDAIVPFDDQILERFKRALKDSCRYPCYSMIVSFSRNEFNPDEPDDLRKARDLMQNVLPKMYPDRQIAIYFQADGRSNKPCLHCHCIIGNISIKDKSALRTNREFYRVKNTFNRLASEALDYDGKQLINLDYGHGSANRQTKAERGMHISNKENSSKKFVLKDMFKQYIRATMDIAESREEFKLLMAAVGFDIEYRTADMNLRTDPVHGASKEFGDYYLIRLEDKSLIPNNTRIKNLASKSFKLGPEYSLAELDKQFESNLKSKTTGTEIAFINESQSLFESIETNAEITKDYEDEQPFINEDNPAIFDEIMGIQIDDEHNTDLQVAKSVSKGHTAKDTMLRIRDKEDREWSDNDDLGLSEALQRTESSRRLARLLVQEAQDELEYERNRVRDFSL